MTENHDYNTPEKGATDWHIPLNENFERIDGDVEIRDEDANRSEYTPKPGAKFLATDTENEYIGDGSEWQKLATSGKSPSFDSVQTGVLQHATDDGGTRRKLLDTVDATDEDGIDYDSGKLPLFDAYEVNFSVRGGLGCAVNDVDHNQRYEYVTITSGRLADQLLDDQIGVTEPAIERRKSGSWPVAGSRGGTSGTLLVHGPNVADDGGTFMKTTATVTATRGPEGVVMDCGIVKTRDPVRRLRISGGSGKLNVYGIDVVR